MDHSIQLFSVTLTLAMVVAYTPLFFAMVLTIKYPLRLPVALGLLSTVMALLGGLIMPIALLPLGLIVLGCYGSQTNVHRAIKPFCIGFIFILSWLIFFHKTPGFNNPILIQGLKLNPNSLPYTLYLNFDKTILALILLVFLKQTRNTFKKPFEDSLKSTVQSPFNPIQVTVVTFIILLVTIAGGIFANAVAWDPKWPAIYGVWALTNLFTTCVFEEVFFRGFIQSGLQNSLLKFGKKTNLATVTIAALVITALLFGLVHLPGGIVYATLATLSGLAYGYVYQQTGQLRWAITTHFAFNNLHLLLFSYPLLAN